MFDPNPDRISAKLKTQTKEKRLIGCAQTIRKTVGYALYTLTQWQCQQVSG